MNFRVLYTLYFALVILVIFAIGASVVSKDTVEGFKDGYESGYSYGNDNTGQNIWKFVTVPNNYRVNPSSVETYGVVSDSTTHVEVAADMLDVTVYNSDKLPKKFHNYVLLQLISSILTTGLIIYLIVLLWKLFRRMQKSLKKREAFSMSVVKVLKSLGVVLIILNVVLSVLYYFQNKAAQVVLAEYGYDVDYFWEIDYISIIFGLSLILVSEFLKIGYRIQEEQNLTV